MFISDSFNTNFGNNKPIHRLGPHYRLFIGRQFSWLLNKIDRKQFSLPGGRGSYPIGLNYRPII
jgi:hypothetical protein